MYASTGSRLSLQDRLIKPELPADRGDVFPVVFYNIEEIVETLSKDTFLHSQFNLRYGVAAKFGCCDWKRLIFLTAKDIRKALVLFWNSVVC